MLLRSGSQEICSRTDSALWVELGTAQNEQTDEIGIEISLRKRKIVYQDYKKITWTNENSRCWRFKYYGIEMWHFSSKSQGSSFGELKISSN